MTGLTNLPIRTCECCERKVMGDFTGWIIDGEGNDFCPDCAHSLTGQKVRELAADSLRALETLRRMTGVDEWDESDWRCLAYNDAYDVLGEDRYAEIMGEVQHDDYVLVDDVREALNAIDDYAAKDLDHELHAIVEHYRGALGCREANSDA